MEFGFTEAQEKLRKEIHDFFANELPSDYQPGKSAERAATMKRFEFWMELQKKAGSKGYLAPGWSKESGWSWKKPDTGGWPGPVQWD